MIYLITVDTGLTVTLPGDAWFTDLTKPRPVVIRKSLDGTPYSYVQTEQAPLTEGVASTVYQRTLSFEHLDKERVVELHEFLEAAEGQLLLMRDGKNHTHLMQLVPDSIEITATKRAARRDADGAQMEDYWHQVSFKVQISHSEGSTIA
jgi:hypothetical protein